MKYQVRKSVWESNSSSMHSLIVTKKNPNVRMTREEIRAEYYLDAPWIKERIKKAGKEILHIDVCGGNDFDRSPFTVLSSFREKLLYAIAEYCGSNYTIQSYVEAEKRFNDMFVPLLIRLTGCDEVEYGKEHCTAFAIYSDIGGEYMDEVEEVDYTDLIVAGYKDNIPKDDKILGVYKNVAGNGRPIEEAYFEVPDYGSVDHQSSGLLRRFLVDNNLSLEDYLVRKDVAVVIDGDEYCELGKLIDCGMIDKDSIVLICPDRGWLANKETAS